MESNCKQDTNKALSFSTIDKIFDIITSFLEADQSKLNQTVEELKMKYGKENEQRYIKF